MTHIQALLNSTDNAGLSMKLNFSDAQSLQQTDSLRHIVFTYTNTHLADENRSILYTFVKVSLLYRSEVD